MPPFKTPMPYVVHPRVDGLIPLRTVREPVVDACFVPINGNDLEAERTADALAMLTGLAAEHEALSDGQVRQVLRRVATLVVMLLPAAVAVVAALDNGAAS